MIQTRVLNVSGLAAVLLLLSACAAAPPPKYDTTTPEKTITAYQDAWNDQDCEGLLTFFDTEVWKERGLEGCKDIAEKFTPGIEQKMTPTGTVRAENGTARVTFDYQVGSDSSGSTYAELEERGGLWHITKLN